MPRTRAVDGAKPADRLMPLEPLLGRTWAGAGEWATGGGIQIRSAVEWVPLAEAVYVRVTGRDGQHLLDVYLFHHTGANVRRCLALSHRGGVYEGDVTPTDGGLMFDLTGHVDGPATRHAVRLDYEGPVLCKN